MLVADGDDGYLEFGGIDILLVKAANIVGDGWSVRDGVCVCVVCVCGVCVCVCFIIEQGQTTPHTHITHTHTHTHHIAKLFC